MSARMRSDILICTCTILYSIRIMKPDAHVQKFFFPVVIVTLFLQGCESFKAGAELGGTQHIAKNTVLVVDPAAENIAYRRLVAWGKVSEGFGEFLKEHGYPTYVYEGRRARSAVLFYLEKRLAYGFELLPESLELRGIGQHPIAPDFVDYKGIVRSFFPDSKIH